MSDKTNISVPERTKQIVQLMKNLKCDAAFVSADRIISRIEEIDYRTVDALNQRFMYCYIRMDNGFVVTGKPSVCVSRENFREEIGHKVSFENAFSEIFALEAYRMVSEKVDGQ